MPLLSEINECISRPCTNGGLCIEGVNSYTCHCPPGYTGILCQTGKYTAKYLPLNILFRYAPINNNYNVERNGRNGSLFEML